MAVDVENMVILLAYHPDSQAEVAEDGRIGQTPVISAKRLGVHVALVA